MPPKKINLQEKFARITEYWQPRLAGTVGETHLKMCKLMGEFEWHSHAGEDECFWLVAGELCIKFRDGDVWLAPGEFLVIPKTVEHCPFAPAEAQVVLIEPAGTVNTGDNPAGERTVAEIKPV